MLTISVSEVTKKNLTPCLYLIISDEPLMKMFHSIFVLKGIFKGSFHIYNIYRFMCDLRM